ncbi:HesA/MoeB/ThiF family protein [Moraxella marmotae]|uniref:HesA/MoeB/ThiF family protein n=1 Tax=Moraxella marmotae TaxID=3344520 RepID=UPI0035F37EF9
MPSNNPNHHTALSDAELMRYSRQILLDGWDIDAQIRLKNACIAIIGMGGLGSVVAPILVRAGVGKVHLFDFDTVDDSNLQRQLLYTQADIGTPKVQAAQKALAAQNNLVVVMAHHLQLNDANIAKTLTPLMADLWIDCSDNFAIRHALNHHAVASRTSLLSLSAIGEVGQAALFEPADTGCYACLFGTKSDTATNCASSGVLASTVAVIGSLGADAALHFLGQNLNCLKNQLLIWQGKRATLQKMTFNKAENCPICHNL